MGFLRFLWKRPLASKYLSFAGLVVNFAATVSVLLAFQLKRFGEFPLPQAAVVFRHYPWLMPVGWGALMFGFSLQVIAKLREIKSPISN